MKPITLASALLCLCCSSAFAAARVGVHPGYVRLVLDVPAHTTIRQTRQTSTPGKTAASTLNITLSQPLPAAHAALNQTVLHGYQTRGKTVQLFLNRANQSRAGQVQVRLLAAQPGQSARLVVDIPSNGASYAPPPARPAVATHAATRPPTTVSNRAISNRAASSVVVVRSTAAHRPARPQVVLDAGHGGIDPGMRSPWVTEKEVTLDVALRVRALLQAHGVQVRMVRDTDRDLSDDKATDLDARSRMAEADKVAAYIAIHVNAGGPDAQGIETYYFGQPMGGSTRSLAVAENGGDDVGRALTRKAASMAQSTMGDILAQAKLSFSRQLAQRVQANLLSTTGALNRGVHTDAFYVIRNPKTAAILTEIGFGSSPSEGPKLATGAYRQKIAEGIAQAILEFLHVD